MTTGNAPPVPAAPEPNEDTGHTDQHAARDGKGRFVRTPDSAERDARAAQLRAQGWKLTAIAKELGFYDHSTVRQAIKRALREIVQGPAEQLLALYMDRLEDIFSRAMEIADDDHVVVSHGRIVTGADGQPLKDNGPTLAAFREARAALADVRKMVGLDQPTQVQVSGGVRYEVVGVDPTDLT